MATSEETMSHSQNKIKTNNSEMISESHLSLVSIENI